MEAKHEQLDPAVVALLRQVAGADAEMFVHELLLPSWAKALECTTDLDDIRASVRKGKAALRLLLCHYVFGHRRFLRFNASKAAKIAVDTTVQDMQQFLKSAETDAFWEEFAQHLSSKANKTLDQLNSLVEGILSLCIDVYRLCGEESLLWWMVEEIRETRRVEHLHQSLHDIRGLGPKTLSRILRDLVVVFDLEQMVHPADRYLLTVVGKPVRMLGPQIVSEALERKLPDWVLAGKVSKACRLAGVSVARFNMGSEWRLLQADGAAED